MDKKVELTDLPGVGAATAEKLKEAGYDTVLSLAVISPGELITVAGVTEQAARKIINAAILAKEAWAIKWSLVEYKSTGVTQDQVNALTEKVDKRTHALMLSIIKYWSERHPDEGVRGELQWYYTKWIEINSLTQLTRPRTNEELASSLQNLYSRDSVDSLNNGTQPKDLDIQREIVSLQNQIVRARSQKEADRLKLELLTLQNSFRA